MKFKIIETWHTYGNPSQPSMNFVDVGMNGKVYYDRLTRFCSKKAADKFMNTWKPVYAEADTWRTQEEDQLTLAEESIATKKRSWGFVYEAVLDEVQNH